LVGFGGGLGLGAADIYQTPYDPMQLARVGFISNMKDAELHGARTTSYQPIAVLDGFSQIGTRRYWQGHARQGAPAVTLCPTCGGKGFAPSARANHCGFCDGQENNDTDETLFSLMQSWGIVHHAYDAALGCFARRLGYQVWLAPIACHHYGGQTAVGDPGYHTWAQQQTEGGDAGFWQHAHGVVYHEFKDVLPIRV
jgi:hypothetical protein